MVKRSVAPNLYVLAGTNGAGKSSIGGAAFRSAGAEYFNPDEAARLIESANPGFSKSDANSAAWHQGKRLLERAIAERADFAFETTLGGRTMTDLLWKALQKGFEVRIWYVGLATPELHLARVCSRVQEGGHDIPEAKIRERYTQSRLNLIHLLPKLTELLLYDNSEQADLGRGDGPKPKLILHMVKGRISDSCDLDEVPEWAKPIMTTALRFCKP